MQTIHVINLPKRTDRRDSILEEAQVQKFQIHFWEGIKNKHYPRTAISQAHKKIVRYAKEQNLSSILIAEDDIKFSHPKAFRYFLSKIPKDYDLFMGLIYAGHIEDGRVKNGFSGGLTLYSIHKNFYDIFLTADENNHLDRWLGSIAYKQKYFVCDPMVCYQMGGWSDNLLRTLEYSEYLKGKKLYGQV